MGTDFPTWPLDHAHPEAGNVWSVSRVYCGRVLPWLVEIGEWRTARRGGGHYRRIDTGKAKVRFKLSRGSCLLLLPFFFPLFSSFFNLIFPYRFLFSLTKGNRVNRSQICVDELNAPLPYFISWRSEFRAGWRIKAKLTETRLIVSQSFLPKVL